jgi:hypothetical protein
MSINYLPSIGTATGTRVDSAAKHIMSCKVDTRLFSCWLKENVDTMSLLHNEKMKWCMHKDEVVLNTSKKSDGGDSCVKAYPMVVTTVGDMHPYTRHYLTFLYKQSNVLNFFRYQQAAHGTSAINNHSLRTITDFCGEQRNEDGGVNTFNQADWDEKVLNQIKKLPDFRCQGVALGQAWANYLSGDTVASVLVGGMVTVQNGHFTMHTGDLVQWYFDWERPQFQHDNKNNGRRTPVRVNATADPRNRKRKKYMDERLYGNSSSVGRSSGAKNPSTVARIKSYRMNTPGPAAAESVLMQDHYGDKTRVFAKCISGGRAFDLVDIMLMTQST